MSLTPSVHAKVRSPGLRNQKRAFKVDGPTINNDDTSPDLLNLEKPNAGNNLTLKDRMEDSMILRLGNLLNRTSLKIESDNDIRAANDS